MLSTQLVPHTSRTSNHIGVRDDGIEAIKHSPVLIDSVRVTIKIVETSIQVDNIIVRQYYLIRTSRQSSLIELIPPPVNHILILKRQINLLVGPVNHLLSRTDILSEQLLLILPIINRQFRIIGDIIIFHVLINACGIPTVESDLISSKMNIVIIESVIDIGKDLGNHIPCLVQSRIKLTHIDAIAGKSNVSILRTTTPRLSMSRSINFRNHSNPPFLRIRNNTQNVLLTKRPTNTATITQLRNGRHHHRESIFINDMPVEDVQLDVKHSIDLTLYRINIQEVSGGVDHQRSPYVLRPVSNSNGKTSNLVGPIILLVEQLRKRLERSQKTYIVIGLDCPLTHIWKRKRVFLVSEIKGSKLSSILDVDSNLNFSLISLGAPEHLQLIQRNNLLDVDLVRRVYYKSETARRNSDVRTCRVVGKAGGHGPKGIARMRESSEGSPQQHESAHNSTQSHAINDLFTIITVTNNI